MMMKVTAISRFESARNLGPSLEGQLAARQPLCCFNLGNSFKGGGLLSLPPLSTTTSLPFSVSQALVIG